MSHSSIKLLRPTPKPQSNLFRSYADNLNVSMSNMSSSDKDILFGEFLNETFDGLNPEKIVFLMTLPNPDTAVAAATVVSGATKAIPISGDIGYCVEYPNGNPG